MSYHLVYVLNTYQRVTSIVRSDNIDALNLHGIYIYDVCSIITAIPSSPHIHHRHPSFHLPNPHPTHSTMASYSLSSFPLAGFTTDLISSLAILTNSALDGVVAALLTYYTHRADTEVQDLHRTISALQADKIELRHQLLQLQIQTEQTISELRAEKMELSHQVQLRQMQVQNQDGRMVDELREGMEKLRGELRQRDVKIRGLEEKCNQLARERRGKFWGLVRSGLCSGM